MACKEANILARDAVLDEMGKVPKKVGGCLPLGESAGIVQKSASVAVSKWALNREDRNAGGGVQGLAVVG
jgi:ribonuclease HIII